MVTYFIYCYVQPWVASLPGRALWNRTLSDLHDVRIPPLYYYCLLRLYTQSYGRCFVFSEIYVTCPCKECNENVPCPFAHNFFLPIIPRRRMEWCILSEESGVCHCRIIRCICAVLIPMMGHGWPGVICCHYHPVQEWVSWTPAVILWCRTRFSCFLSEIQPLFRVHTSVTLDAVVYLCWLLAVQGMLM